MNGSGNRWICYALHSARQHRVGTDKAYYQLLELIEHRLDPTGVIATLELWLLRRGHLKKGEEMCPTPKAFAKLQRTRLAWIDSLIVEFGGTP
jgi:hypothetical protein